jgi:hypothetical protein
MYSSESSGSERRESRMGVGFGPERQNYIEDSVITQPMDYSVGYAMTKLGSSSNLFTHWRNDNRASCADPFIDIPVSVFAVLKIIDF